jgi:hypothetical protein
MFENQKSSPDNSQETAVEKIMRLSFKRPSENRKTV